MSGLCQLLLRQQHQQLDLFASDEHVAHEVIWSVYQNMVETATRAGKAQMRAESNALASARVSSHLPKLITQGRKIERRAETSWPTKTTTLQLEPPHRTDQWGPAPFTWLRSRILKSIPPT